MPDVHDHISYLLGRVGRALRADRARRLKVADLHCGQDRLLLHLQEEDGLSPSALAARLGVEPPTVTKMAQRLERAGLLRRTPDPNDARSARLHLTEEGRACCAAAEACWHRVERDVLAGFSDEEAEGLRRLLLRVLSNLDAA